MSAFNPAAVARSRVPLVLSALIAVVAALALAMSWQSTASADPAYPPSNSCSLSSADGSSFTPGEHVTLIGSGFGAHAQVRLSISTHHTSLGTVTTDATGAFRTTVTIPANLGDGSHVLTASSPTTSCSFDPTVTTPSKQGYQVVGVASTAKPTGTKPTGEAGLASTGFQTATAIGVGVVVIGGGVMLLLIGRRRKA
jgi:hypothetical protein